MVEEEGEYEYAQGEEDGEQMEDPDYEDPARYEQQIYAEH
jgi:hypothetical protein